MRTLFIQYAGDFPEAYQRLVVGNGPETYYAQKYTVSEVSGYAEKGSVLVIVLNDKEGIIQVARNLKVMGMVNGHRRIARIKTAIRQFRPDRAIILTPNLPILAFLRRQGIPTLPMLADSFRLVDWPRVRMHLFNHRLANELNRSHYTWIGNHQINAAHSLADIGVHASKIVPYDWPHDHNPDQWKPRIRRTTGGGIRLFYAGLLVESKGVGDLINAVELMIAEGHEVVLRLAGSLPAEEAIQNRSDRLPDGSVLFLGRISHDQVLTEMATADLVVVPSRHEYPEGLPMTIMEALTTRTPVIASDHPMFVGRVGGHGAVRFFKERDVIDIGRQILDIWQDPFSYMQASENAALEWKALCLDVKWADMIAQWWVDPQYTGLSPHSLISWIRQNQGAPTTHQEETTRSLV